MDSGVCEEEGSPGALCMFRGNAFKDNNHGELHSSSAIFVQKERILIAPKIIKTLSYAIPVNKVRCHCCISSLHYELKKINPYWRTICIGPYYTPPPLIPTPRDDSLLEKSYHHVLESSCTKPQFSEAPKHLAFRSKETVQE